MKYLLMAAVLTSWTTLAFVYRWAEAKKANRIVMGAAIGAIATLWTLAYAALTGVNLWQADPTQFALGAAVGVLSVAGIPLFMAAVARGDLSITWTALTLSFALASVMVIVYPGEQASAMGVVALVMASAAIALLGLDMVQRHRSDGPGKPRRGWGLFMSLAFVSNALTMYSFSLSSAWQPDNAMSHKLAFLFALYAAFAVGSLIAAAFAGRRGSAKSGFGIGLVAGTLLLAGGLLTLIALSTAKVPGYILYPSTTGGSSVAVVALSVVLLRERPGGYGWAGIVAGVSALVLFGLAT